MRVAEPASGSMVDDLLPTWGQATILVIKESLVLFRREKAWTNAIDADSATGPFPCHKLSKVDYRRFSCGICHNT